MLFSLTELNKNDKLNMKFSFWSQLALFLDSSEGKVDVAKSVVETYYDCRKQAPEQFSFRDPNSEEIQQCLENQ